MEQKHVWADEAFAAYLTENLYHPRSSKHGDFLCKQVLADLVQKCPRLREDVTTGRVSFKLNHPIDPDSPLQWTIDLVIGPAPEAVRGKPHQGVAIEASPIQIFVALDAKSVMTEHGKARRNRLRDLNSLHDLLHRSNPHAIVGGLIVLNIGSQFKSPLRGGEVTEHQNIRRLVEEIITMFEGIPRSSSGNGNGLDAMGIIVVNHTNIPGEPCVLVRDAPAPQAGSATHYQTFLNDICRCYTERFPR